MTRTLLALKLRLFRNGPHDERAFSLVTGLVLAGGVIAAAVLAAREVIDEGWILLALTGWGAMWLFGPLAQPRPEPSVVSREWLRGLPVRPVRLARALSWPELLGVGPLITGVCLSSLVVLAAPGGAGPVAVAVLAAPAQLHLLVWAGKTVAALAAGLLRTRAGMTLAAVQTAIMLAVSFAGWVPVAAWLLPRLGDGLRLGRAVDVLAVLPTGWGFSAVLAARESDWRGAALPVAGLLIGGAVLRGCWIALTARALRRPPRRASAPGYRRSLPVSDAVVFRELATWSRDPARGVELRSAWLTPVLMGLIVAGSGWWWAVPLAGPAVAVFGAMVAINTYALDGTAIWQLLTTPGAPRADVRGRMAAWGLLFGVPSVALSVVLWAVTGSPLGVAAVGGAVAASAVGCALAPLLAVVMPAVGADARNRVHAVQRAGDPTGGQMTIFPAVLVAAVLPGAVAAAAGGRWWVAALIASGLAAVALTVLPPVTVRLLERRGTGLLDAMQRV
ncbi:hypothetical protein AB0F81_37685 [Actinoplanes sp. NPDC024001]|uniref:hypothetical protein n=1 Tax=Actinoplanes sp. NPDC024001 TaxID=3154598 RepID=UPI0034103F0D